MENEFLHGNKMSGFNRRVISEGRWCSLRALFTADTYPIFWSDFINLISRISDSFVKFFKLQELSITVISIND